MAEQQILARSPIAPTGPTTVVAGWVVSALRSTSPLTVVDQTPLAKVVVRADAVGRLADALAVGAGHVSRPRVSGATGVVLVTSVAPGEWLVLAAPGEQRLVIDWLEALVPRSDAFVSVVDLTHGRALLRLTGPSAVDVLAKECAVDLSDRGFPDQRTLRTSVAGLAVDVVRDDQAGVPSYLLHCERSSGQYLADVVLEAGAELGIDVDGFRPHGSHDKHDNRD
ncbi:MAG: sarcosine oxidase subunit gamma family protein [Nocardioides sp.]